MVSSTHGLARLIAIAILCGACSGGSTSAQPDAGAHPDGPPADMTNHVTACTEFDAPGQPVPAHVTGTLAGADLQSPASCTTVDAPFGIESAGPDSVVRVDGLVAGKTYVVKLSSVSDLAFYVATGCGTSTGPSADQCLLFVDATKTGEVGSFVATGSSAFVVVDYYAATPPDNLAFTLDVYADECVTSSTCGGGADVCLDHQCVECASSFDCTSAAKARCDTATHTCVAGSDQCTTDDAAEPGDDGPAGATVLGPSDSHTAKMCASPLLVEADYYAFDVTTVGEDWLVQLGWSNSRDLDLEVFDATGTLVGMSLWERPESVEVTYLPPGRYYARVTEYATSANPTPVSYTIQTAHATGPGCTSAHDCASPYRNQIYRGACTAGSCVALDGSGATTEGGACDSQSDCASGLHCPSFYFVANADTRETCSRECTTDVQCDVGDVCTTYLPTNFCVPACTSTSQCATSITSAPSSGPWARLTCEQSTGRCLP